MELRNSREAESCSKGHTILKDSCRDCQKLKKEWYGYLSSTGFEDIEKGERLTDHNSVIDFNYRKDFKTQDTFKAKASYYQWARRKLNEVSFSTERDRLIWEFHAEGLSRRKIAPRVGMEHSWISRKIKRLEEYLKVHSVSSGSMQLDLFYWSKADSPF